jgi:hypothetical protein
MKDGRIYLEMVEVEDEMGVAVTNHLFCTQMQLYELFNNSVV